MFPPPWMSCMDVCKKINVLVPPPYSLPWWPVTLGTCVNEDIFKLDCRLMTRTIFLRYHIPNSLLSNFFFFLVQIKFEILGILNKVDHIKLGTFAAFFLYHLKGLCFPSHKVTTCQWALLPDPCKLVNLIMTQK